MIGGVYVASVTPMGPGGEVDLDALRAHLEWLLSAGVDGIVLFGTNGEGPLLSVREKLHVLDAICSQLGHAQLVPAIMEGNPPDVREYVRHANDWPLAALLVLPPYYYKPVAEEGLRRFFAEVLELSRHPVIAYHIPKYAIPVPAELVVELPLWGAKDSGGDPAYSAALLEGGRGVLIGTEDDLWTRLRGGAHGLVSALANAIPETVVALYRLARASDAAGEALARRVQHVRAYVKQAGGISALKRLAQARHGVRLGSVRLPLLTGAQDVEWDRVRRLLGLDGAAAS